MIYFDNGATTLWKPAQVSKAVQYAMEHYASPGRGGYSAAMDAAKAVLRCRELAAILFDTEPETVVFTMTATPALNIALQTLVSAGDTVVVSGFEHNAVMRPLHAIGANVVVAGKKLFDPEDTVREFDNAVTLRTKAVICTHVSNVFGYRLPIEEIAALCAKRNVPLIVDAAQSAGSLPISLRKLGAAFLAMPGLLEGGTRSQSQLFEMPDFLPDAGEAGTHNVPGICGLAEGIRFVCEKGPEKILHHEQNVLQILKESCGREKGLRCFTGGDSVQTNVLSLCVDGMDCEEAARRLGDRGVAVRAGLHCAPLAHQSGGTLECGTVRLSVSAFNTEEEAVKVSRILRSFVN